MSVLERILSVAGLVGIIVVLVCIIIITHA